MVTYDWDVESVAAVAHDAYEVGDVLDHDGAESYAEARKAAQAPRDASVRTLIALVRDDRHGRSWAYVTDGVLDSWCRSAAGAPVARTPQRFVLEVKRVETAS